MKRLVAVWICLGWSVLACTEVIDLGAERGPSQLLVFGRLTSGLEGNLIEIATTSTINNGQSPVVDAVVTVVAEDGVREDYVHISEGIYELHNNLIIGEPGKEYYLEIDLTDGRKYQSTSSRMPGKVAQDFLNYEPREVERLITRTGIIRRSVVDVTVRTEIFNPEEDHYIRWNTLETWQFPELPPLRTSPLDPAPQGPFWCYVTTELEPQRVVLHDGSELKVNEIPWRTMNEMKYDSTFALIYFYQLVQSSLTADAHRFWNELDLVSNTEGSIFDQPLGRIVGNVFNVNDPREQVLGYFEVSHVDTTRIQIDDEGIPFIISKPCKNDPTAPICSDCLSIKNSVKEKPYWLD